MVTLKGKRPLRVESECEHEKLSFASQAAAYRDVLFDASAREDAMQLWAQLALAEQREDDGVGEDGLQGLFAVGAAVDAEQHLLGLLLRSVFAGALHALDVAGRVEVFGQRDVVQEVGQAATAMRALG